ncbi:MAG: OST-HTH/LOTUS domain-containing protein, partial [Nitrososphaerota archaeon]|nr:OST-HTH/LOTUS domain-containing protein [Nitrososphaerota archaeon]
PLGATDPCISTPKLQGRIPPFDPRTFGRSKLMLLLDAIPEEFLLEKPKDGRPGVVFVRRKRAPR